MLSREVYPSASVFPARKGNSSFFRKTLAPFILLLDFSQTLTSLKQVPYLLPSIPKLITCRGLTGGQSANTERTCTVPKQQMQNSPVRFHSLWNKVIGVHGACLQDANYTSQYMVHSFSMPGTSWKLCVRSWIMLHPRLCFLPQKKGGGRGA